MGLNQKIETGAVLIISIVVLFFLFSALVPEVQTSGDSLNASNRCEAVGCVYNATLSSTSPCRFNTSQIDDGAFGCENDLGDGIPLARLFGSGGIVVILLMVVLLIMIIRMVLPKKK